jgi:hypothetical protein
MRGGAGQGMAGLGGAMLGKGNTNGTVLCVGASPARWFSHCEAGLGEAQHGVARQGWARQG